MEDKLHDVAAPGIKAEWELAQKLRREVATLLSRSQLSFPGAQPISFARHHLDELKEVDYYVCEKSDGIRYLLYCTYDEEQQEVQYLIDRKNDYWFVPPGKLHFPLEDDQLKFHVDSLVDGELVMEDMGGGQKQAKFFVFDCLVLDKQDLTKRALDKRLGFFQQKIFKPYDTLFKKYPQERQFQLFHMEMKGMQFSYGIEMMFRDIIPNLKHDNDGLIFTCRNTEYHSGTDEHILKWKPATENTIDFRIQLRFKILPPSPGDASAQPYPDYDAIPEADLLAYMGEKGERYQFFAHCYLDEDDWEKLKGTGDPISGRIVECAMDSEGRWRLHKFRDDKPQANHISTVDKVMDSIRDGVSAQELMDAAKTIKDRWKMRQAHQK